MEVKIRMYVSSASIMYELDLEMKLFPGGLFKGLSV